MSSAATVFGHALYGLARDEGVGEGILNQLKTLNRCFSAEPAFLRLLNCPSISKEVRCSILDNVLGDQVHPYVLYFLKLLTGNGRIGQFSGCCDTYEQAFNRDNGILRVRAVTPLPLTEELRSQLIEKLSAVTGKTIELDCRLDPVVLGGIRLEFGGRRLDGTIRHQLETLRVRLDKRPF